MVVKTAKRSVYSSSHKGRRNGLALSFDADRGGRRRRAGIQYLVSFGGSPHSHLPDCQLNRATLRLIISSRHLLRVTMKAVR